MPDTFAALRHQRIRAEKIPCCPTWAHTLHFHIHKPLKWASAAAFVAGSALEHFAVSAVFGSLFIGAHVFTWVIAE